MVSCVSVAKVNHIIPLKIIAYSLEHLIMTEKYSAPGGDQTQHLLHSG